MTEKGEPRPFMGELRVLMGECRDPEGPNEVGLSSDGCIPRWDVGELRGEDVTCPVQSVGRKVERNSEKIYFKSVAKKNPYKYNEAHFTHLGEKTKDRWSHGCTAFLYLPQVRH